MEIKYFDKRNKMWLQHALADFLGINFNDIHISTYKEGSVKIYAKLPPESVEKLIRAYSEKIPIN